VEKFVHVVFDEIVHSDQSSTKVYAEEDEHNITLEKLESCTDKQSIDYAKQLVEILQQEELPKEWRIPRDFSMENIIGCKWVFRNKLDESEVITRNKARLVAKGYNQEEDINYIKKKNLCSSCKIRSCKVVAGLCLYEWIQIVSNGC